MEERPGGIVHVEVIMGQQGGVAVPSEDDMCMAQQGGQEGFEQWVRLLPSIEAKEKVGREWRDV